MRQLRLACRFGSIKRMFLEDIEQEIDSVLESWIDDMMGQFDVIGAWFDYATDIGV